MASTSGSAVCAALKAAMPKLTSTPASRPEAIAIGMRFITRSNQPVTPHNKISPAQTMNAPVAWPRSNPSPALASTAAPGVLQAIITGWRRISEGMALVSPMPRPSAHIQELITSCDAPKACAA